MILKWTAGHLISLRAVATIRIMDCVADSLIGGRPLLAVFGGHPPRYGSQAADIKNGSVATEGDQRMRTDREYL